jgi:hypothetical protein
MATKTNEKELTLNEKLATIQTKFKSKKSRFNSFGKYNFRSAEDILEAIKPYLLELGVSVVVPAAAKPKLEGEALVKAKEYLEKGGSLDAIKTKYDVSPEILATL